MSIIKTTHSGSKAIRVIDEKTIIDELAKLGYTYNYTLKCLSCSKNQLPDIIISHFYYTGSGMFNIHLHYTSRIPKSHCITTMYDLFNLIKELKTTCQS